MGNSQSVYAPNPLDGLDVYWPSSTFTMTQVPLYQERMLILLDLLKIYINYIKYAKEIIKATISNHKKFLGTLDKPPKGVLPIRDLTMLELEKAKEFYLLIKKTYLVNLKAVKKKVQAKFKKDKPILVKKSSILFNLMRSAVGHMGGVQLVQDIMKKSRRDSVAIDGKVHPDGGVANPIDPWRQEVDLYAILKHLHDAETRFQDYISEYHEDFMQFHDAVVADLLTNMQEFLEAEQTYREEGAKKLEGIVNTEDTSSSKAIVNITLGKVKVPEFLAPAPPGDDPASSPTWVHDSVFTALSRRMKTHWLKEGIIFLYPGPGRKGSPETVHLLLTNAGFLHVFAVKHGAELVKAGEDGNASWAEMKEKLSICLKNPRTAVHPNPTESSPIALNPNEFAVQWQKKASDTRSKKEWVFQTLSERDRSEWVEAIGNLIHETTEETRERLKSI